MGWCTRQWRSVGKLLLYLHFLMMMMVSTSYEKSSPPRKVFGKSNSTALFGVQLQVQSSEQVAVIDNGLFRLYLSIPGGDVTGIGYNGIDNLLETLHDDIDRGYWDVVWNWPDKPITFDRVHGATFEVVTETEDLLELSFVRTWNVSVNETYAPMNIDKRYIIRSGISGFYAYGILDRPEGLPDIDMDQVRIVFKLRKDLFHYMAISDERQRIMPMPEDRETGLPLAYPEAVLLTNPTNPDLRGEIDDKYQYSCENKDNIVHGWISRELPTGFWIITPSNEFRTSGPIKQDLTSHVGPISLSMFVSTHYAGKEVGMKFRDGEPWEKVFGPVLVYLNSDTSEEGVGSLWEDAKKQMAYEVESWPYDFVSFKAFPSSDERGSVAGQLLVADRYLSEEYMWGESAYVGLAPPGEAGSWQRENKGYQFWTRADKIGSFLIEKVRVGDYNLYAWVPGIIGDFKYDVNITIAPGSAIDLGLLVYEPPRQGPTLWEIGIPDRTASEFSVPQPYPTLMNFLHTINNQDKFRQYGLWERYVDLYPESDLVYTIGVSDYRTDWFFAHVTRNAYNLTYTATTWQIIFKLEKVIQSGNYCLQLALASANEAQLQVRFNDPGIDPAHFSTGPIPIGNDNAIARHGIHGLYWLFSIEVPSSHLCSGNNMIFLTQAQAKGPFQGVMYDYIRLEEPPGNLNY